MSDHRRGQLFVAGAATAWSTAGLLQRQLSLDTTTQLAGRALFAFLALAIYVAVANRSRTLAVFTGMGAAGLGVAVATAFASGSFIVALNHASVANVLFLQAAAPMAAALLAWVALRERVTRRTGLAMVVALSGVGVMVGSPGSGGTIGIGATFLMTLSFAVSIVITRHRRDISMAPAICLSQLLVLAVAAPLSEPAAVSTHDLGFLVLMGVGQMGLGLAFLTVGARLIPAAEVALITMLELVLGPLWVWLAYSEGVGLATFAGGVVVTVAVLLQTTQRAPQAQVAVAS
ncbi:MAG: DMT family transporter [Actinobacteria bacterium]|nr:DMT family transporter [Actinomycetota bacterium]